MSTPTRHPLASGGAALRRAPCGGGAFPRSRRINPFTLPEGHVSVAFSGGRTSAMMLHHILDANGGLNGARVLFQNTGREMPATLDFVQECGDRWGVPITWLEYRPEAPRFEVVTHNSASREGEPFAALIAKRGFPPNRVARFCTAELKVHCETRYLSAQGWKMWTKAVGIRADEPGRLTGAPPKERWTPWRPMADAGLSRHDVAAFWQRQPFDLGLPNVGGRSSLGNCDGCFLKSEAHLAALARDYPERAAWWRDQEVASGGTFHPDRTYAGMIDMVSRQGAWIFDADGALCQATDGECTA